MSSRVMAAILALIETEIMPFDPPTLKTHTLKNQTWNGSNVAEISPFEYSKMAAGRHLGFDQTRNCAIRPADTKKTQPSTKYEVDLMTRCGDMAIRNST